MSNSNGKIYGSVSIGDIKTVLGESSNKLSELSKSSLIRPNTFYKPCSLDIHGPLSDDQRRMANWGWNIPYQSIGETLKDVGKGTDSYIWKHNAPYRNYRIGDFRGYNHNAEIPFRFTIPDTYSGSGNFYFEVSDFEEFSNFDKWGIFSDRDLDRLGFAVWITRSPSSHSDYTTYQLALLAGYNATSTFRDLISSDKGLHISSNLMSILAGYNGTYYFIPVLILDSYGLTPASNGTISVTAGALSGVIRFPQSMLSFTVSSSGGNTSPERDAITISVDVVNNDENYLYSLTYSVTFNNSSVYKAAVDFIVDVGYLGDNDTITRSKTFTSSGSQTETYNTTVLGQGTITAKVSIWQTGLIGSSTYTYSLGSVNK